MILDKPEEPGKKHALAFTIAVHVALLAFLFFGVQWKRSKPEVMEVELWSPKPMPAQYVPPPPPPPPEPEVKPEPPKPLPEFGSTEDFPLQQALNQLRGMPVMASKTVTERQADAADPAAKR